MQLGRFAKLTAASTLSLALFFAVELAAGAQVAVTVDGNEADFSPPPTIQAGRVFVPLRGVFERLGASVVYSDGTINATGHGRTISLRIGSTQATIDGQEQTLDVAPYIVGASTYVPLRFISQALGASVQWDESDRMVSIESAGGGQQYDSQANDSESDYAPPPNPDYQQPYVTAPNDIWQPGYWAWGQYGYYWVPGTWVAPPQQGYLWTPGYWQANNGGGGGGGGLFAFIAGYWAKQVGYYGGVNYGGGYNGNGYNGAQWQGNNVSYNTSVTRVDPGTNYSTYVAAEAADMAASRISYNGGPHGLTARPTEAQLAVAKAPHLGLTTVQKQHVLTAASDRRQLAKVNNNVPPLLVSAKPLSASNVPEGLVPVKPSDVVAKPPVTHPAVVHAAPVAHPAAAMHAAPAMHPAAAVPAAPVAHPAVVHAAPVAHPAAAVHAAPVAHPAVVHATPVAHPEAAHHAPASPAKPADANAPKDDVHPTPKPPAP